MFFTVNLVSLEVERKVSNIGIDDITVALSWTQQGSDISYNVTVVPQATTRLIRAGPGSDSTTIQLLAILSYNTRYIASIVGTLCGRNISSTAIELIYGELLHS